MVYSNSEDPNQTAPDKVAYANSVDPDQTAPEGAVWSGLHCLPFHYFKKQLHKKQTKV